MDVIYDIGSNNGDDIAYYLMKANKVVAVEANPELCKQIFNRYSQEVESGRLVIENCAVTDGDIGQVDFYISRKNHVWSTLVAPKSLNKNEWKVHRVKAVPITDLIDKHGHPYYIKIDIEGYDEAILKSLVKSEIKPPFISAESHTIGVIAILSEQLGYNSFKLIDGASVSEKYSKRSIFSSIEGKSFEYSFPYDSAGPFGEDIDGPWLDKSSLIKLLAVQGLGWKDIHATSLSEPKPLQLQKSWIHILNQLMSRFIALDAQAQERPAKKSLYINDDWLIWLTMNQYFAGKALRGSKNFSRKLINKLKKLLCK